MIHCHTISFLLITCTGADIRIGRERENRSLSGTPRRGLLHQI